jgi:cobaltochelatase CobN
MRLPKLPVLALVLLSAILAAPPALAKSVLFLSAPPLQAGKYERIAPLAEEAGIDMEYRFIDKPGTETTAAELSRYDLVFIDAPYGTALGAAQARIAPLLPGVTSPWIWIRRDKVAAGGGMSRETAELLNTYYSNGGRANFSALFCQINRRQFGVAGPDCPATVIVPEAGIYHPERRGRVFGELKEYLAWKGVDVTNPPPMVAFLFHKSNIDSDLTGFIDDTVRRIEKGGALAVPVYTPAMDNGEITRLLSLDGKLLANVIINAQIMLNAEGRRMEFETLGIPVIQAMPYRKGEQADWEQDPVSMSPQDIPFYLAQPEYAGVTDPVFAAYARRSDGDIVPIDYQLASVVKKALNLVRLQKLSDSEKKTAILYYNYPPGEKNLGASFLNVPRSLETVLAGFDERGYTVERRDAAVLTDELSSMLKPFYRDGELQALEARGLAARFPLADYRAWFETLPEQVRQPILDRWGPPGRSGMVVEEKGERFFIVPRLKLGNVVLMPQPPRGERVDGREKALYHDTKVPPSHFYLAAYLWARAQFGADALVHFGTHGTAEWQPGKERGLSVYDYPYLVLGDTPVIYPYIVDNIGEALQTKRRGRAVTISHSTPSFSSAGLHGEITQVHELLHTWLNMEDGEVRAKNAQAIRELVARLNLDKDMGWDGAAIDRDFKGFVDALHVHLHDLALYQQPQGLASFGTPAEADLRLLTVMQMLGKPLLAALMPDDPEEMVVTDYTKLRTTPAWDVLDRHVRRGEPYAGSNAALAELLEKGRAYWKALSETRELTNFFAALDGRYIPTSYGGDPVKNPDSLPTGRNLYSFDPSRVPTKAAWEAGREAAEKLIAQHKETHGEFPDKLAFSLWSVETMRHFGVLEAQVLAVMGFMPKWDEGGRVVGIEAIPAAELKRPRVDAVISVTGLYRDHFPNVMKWLAEAARRAGEIDEPGNAVAANTRAVEAALLKEGMTPEKAANLARTRIFSSESGTYGTGLDDATLASDSWGTGKDGKEDRAEGDRKLATLYLDRMQFAYGPDETEWGEKPPVNAYAEHLKGVKGAVLSRTSNLYGMLTTDDPFQYLGGIGLAVRHLSGTSPELYISNLRETGNPRVETAADFLAKDLKARYFHPGWIKAIQKEGYSGALEVLDTVNNLWGWQAIAPETVRNDQWDELKAIYVDDKYKLGMKEWFEKNHPHAQAQIIERMLEAARKEYWQADARTLAELAQRWKELAERYDVVTENEKFRAFVEQAAAGYGLSAPGEAAEAPSGEVQPEQPKPDADAQYQQVEGQRLEKQPQSSTPAPFDWTALIAILLIASALAGGALHQARRSGAALSRHSVSRGV